MSRGGAKHGLMQRALEQATSEYVRTLPGFVATCHWHDCDEPAPRGPRNVTLRKGNSNVWLTLKQIPLCDPHCRVFLATHTVKLKYELHAVPEDMLVQL